jgi:hypothetical protein
MRRTTWARPGAPVLQLLCCDFLLNCDFYFLLPAYQWSTCCTTSSADRLDESS